jgi:hypothetical protein
LKITEYKLAQYIKSLQGKEGVLKYQKLRDVIYGGPLTDGATSLLDVSVKLLGHTLRLVQLDRAFPGRPIPIRRSVNVFVHTVDRGRRLGPMLQKPRILGLRVVVVVQLAVDEVAEVGRIVGQVKLFEKLDEVFKVQNQGIVLKRKYLIGLTKNIKKYMVNYS